MTRFSRSAILSTILAAVGVGQSSPLRAEGPPAIVSHVKVLSGNVHDVSSLDAWKRSCIKPGMTDEQKALAIWQTVVRFQHQDAPPSEFLQNENLVLDPIKMFNVYGYSFCGVAASEVQALARYLGMDARGWTIKAHVVPEVFWDGQWHLLDASLINYFRKPDGKIASVEEIMQAVADWYKANPKYKGNDAELRKFHAEGGWMGWKRGPALLAGCEFYGGDGWLPAHTHGWYSTMQEYDGSAKFPYENGYSQGYQVNIQLRPGERLVRNWSNRGLHLMQPGDAPYSLAGKIGKDFLRYAPWYGDLAPGRIGNGTLEFQPPDAKGFRVKDAAKPAVLEFRMPSSYVYLTGKLSLQAAVGPGGRIQVLLSDNNGLDWKEAGTVTASGPREIDLGPLVLRRYDYRLRLVLQGAGTGLDSLKVLHDIQHSQRPLPALVKGRNSITFSAGPPEGTITIEGSTNPQNKGKQLVYTDFHPQSEGVAGPLMAFKGKEGRITFPVETPGDMTRLRFGCFYRARDPKDMWDLQVSFDEGKTFRSVGRAEGPKVFGAAWVAVADVPPGTRKALVRYAGQQRTVACIFNMRIDADYREPQGGFRPVKIAYVWDEGGQERRDVHVARQPQETYEISCASAPAMKSIVLELAE